MSCAAAVLRAIGRVAAAAVTIAYPTGADAQKVRLEVHPRAGDTVRVSLEHSLTISGAARTGFAAVPPSTTTYRLVAREIVESVTSRAATVLAIVDSVSLAASGAPAPGLFPDLDRSLQGAHVRLRLTPDGASAVIEAPAQMDDDIRALMGEMPAVLPQLAVSVGESWRRDLPLPVKGSAPAPAVLRATIRLDSLTSAGNIAWISLGGTVVPTAGSDTAQRAPASKGTLTGSMVLDRRRGWLLESHATVDIESVVAMPGGGEPLLVRVRVVQSMKAASAR